MTRRFRAAKLASLLLFIALLGVLTPQARAEEIVVDEDFIYVQKVFEGIQDASLIPNTFAISISRTSGDQVITHQLTSGGVDGNPELVQILSDADQNVILRWRVFAPPGLYNVKEVRVSIPNYTVVSSGFGNITTTDAPTTAAILNQKDIKEAGTVDQVNLIWANLTGGEAPYKGNYLVWTLEPLSASQRAAIVKQIGLDLSTVYFFSGRKISLDFKGAILSYDYDTGVLVITHSQFSKAYSATYEYTDASVDLMLSNTYTPIPTVPLTISKTVMGAYGDTAQTFDFEVTDADGTVLSEFSLMHGEDRTIEVPAEQALTITETNAVGYVLSVNGTTLTGYAYTFTPTDAATLNFVNALTIPPPTGVSLDSVPYLLLLAGAAAGGLLLFRRRRDDD